MESDVELVGRVLITKDEHAFASLVMRHQFIVRSLLTRYCRQDRYLVDDLMQETFLRAYLSLSSFRCEAKFSTWLYRIAFNVAADRFRKKSIECSNLDSLHDVADSCKQLNQTDLREDLMKALDSISESQKIAVRLCLHEGYSHADAAAKLNVPLGTLKSHVTRGRAQLQQLLMHWREAA